MDLSGQIQDVILHVLLDMERTNFAAGLVCFLASNLGLNPDAGGLLSNTFDPLESMTCLAFFVFLALAKPVLHLCLKQGEP